MTRRRSRGLLAAGALLAVALGVTACNSGSVPRPRPSSEPAGAGKLLVFERLSGVPAGETMAAEISRPEQLRSFLAEVPEVAEKVRSAVRTKRPEHSRLFGFVVSGCRETGAVLRVREKRIEAVPTGSDARCLRAEYYVAVFALEAGLVPAQPNIGG